MSEGRLRLRVTRLEAPRPGLRVVVEDGAGRTGLGEGHPLDGRGSEDLEERRAALEGLDLCGEPAALAMEVAGRLPERESEAAPVSAAAIFALETALLSLAAVREDLPLWCLLRRAAGLPLDPEPPPPEVNALLPAGLSPEGAAARARALAAAGSRCLKVKVGRGAFEADLAVLRAVRAAVGEGVALRADANGGWTLAEAPARLAALADLGLEYLEQPVPARDLPDLHAVPVPIAADESLAWPKVAERLLEERRCVAFVLKPGLLGLHRSLDLARRARQAGIDPVITHAADGPVALETARALARALGPLARPCGLARA